MKCFRVELQKSLPNPEIRNPFLIPIECFGDCKVLVRVWEFEAEDETEVRRLYEKALSIGEPQVQGMAIRSIREKP